jgi:hypothetical protein
MLGVLERSPNLHLSDAIKSGLANQVGPGPPAKWDRLSGSLLSGIG